MMRIKYYMLIKTIKTSLESAGGRRFPATVVNKKEKLKKRNKKVKYFLNIDNSETRRVK